MIYITRRMEFSASHRLYNPNFSDEKNEAVYGKCNNVNGHGHNYLLEVTLRGTIDAETGMVMDLKALKTLLDDVIIDRVDHKHLNYDVDFLQGLIPTAENIVASFWNLLEPRLPANCELFEMKLWESDNNMAMYRGEGVELARQDLTAAQAVQNGRR